MSNRHLSRSIAMQTLFELDVRDGFDVSDQGYITTIIKGHMEEFAPGLSSHFFAEALVRGVVAKKKVLDEVLTKAAPEWPLEKIPNVDRNILRLGLYELLFGNYTEVPPKVAIDEAIELAKMFGGEASARFTNGVLGRVYKELGEPGKGDTSASKKYDGKTMHTLNLAGGVVYSVDGGIIRLALVHDIFGYWTLSKGRISSETPLEEGAEMKIKEELGISVSVEEKLGENEYISSHPEYKKVKKHVHYFLCRAEYIPLGFVVQGGLDNAAWFTLDELATLKIYDDILPIFEKGIEMISKK